MKTLATFIYEILNYIITLQYIPSFMITSSKFDIKAEVCYTPIGNKVKVNISTTGVNTAGGITSSELVDKRRRCTSYIVTIVHVKKIISEYNKKEIPLNVDAFIFRAE